MKMKHLIILLTLALTSIVKIYSQDRIIKTSNDTISCTIKEINDEEIEYIDNDISKDILIGINKDDVTKVILANGKELYFKENLYNPDNYVTDKKHNIKINFLSPLFNSTNITYEKSIWPGRSIEGTIGIIGLGWELSDRNQQGAFCKFGYKFINTRDFYLKGRRFAHVLKGSYFKPELAFSAYKWIDEDYDSVYGYETNPSRTKTNTVMGGILLNFGKQWVFKSGFVVDSFVGVGYGIGKNKDELYFHRAFIGGDDDFPIAFTSGLRVGWNF